MTKYAPWRNICSVEFEEWRRRIPAPVPLSPSYDQLMALPDGPRHEEFTQCLTRQAQSFSTRIPGYQSPDVWEVRRRVQAAKEAKGMNVTVVVFWGRRRYVSILVPYLERNLAVNGGVVDDVLLLVGAPGMDRDGPSVTTMDIINSLTSKYPGVMKALPMCKLKWTCAYNAYMTDKRTVYIKLDDDTVFIKDGTFEHLAYENLMSEDYLLYSANVVNHVWGNGVNHFAGRSTCLYCRTCLLIAIVVAFASV